MRIAELFLLKLLKASRSQLKASRSQRILVRRANRHVAYPGRAFGDAGHFDRSAL